MGRIKGAHEQKRRGDYDMRPKNWLETIPLVFLADVENLKRMEDYLRLNKVQAEWCNGGMALLTSIDSQPKYSRMIERQSSRERYNLRFWEWAPIKDGESLRQNIPLQTLKDLIQNNYPKESCRIYIVSENDTVFYVGQANNPRSRIIERLHPYAKKELFTTFFRTYLDDAYASWRFQLLTLKDCESVVVKSFLKPQFDAEIIRSEIIDKYNRTNDRDIKWAMNQAEHVLIWLYQPCLNEKHTPFPTQLPAKYSEFSIPAPFKRSF